MIYYWYITTVNPHGLSNGARVRVQNTGIPAIDDKDFAAEVVSDTKIRLLKLSLVGEPGPFSVEDRVVNTYGLTVEQGRIRHGVLSALGLQHLEGLTVVGLGDGECLGEMVVTDGAVTLPGTYSKLTIGLRYDAVFEPTGVAMSQEVGPALAQVKNIRNAVAYIKDTCGAKVTDASGTYYRICEFQVDPARYESLCAIGATPVKATDTWNDLVNKPGYDEKSDDPYLFTGEVRIDVDMAHSTEPRIILRHGDPLPFNILSLSYNYTVTESTGSIR